MDDELRADLVADGRIDEARIAVPSPLHRGHAGHALDDVVVGRPFGIGTGLTETDQRHVDEAGVHGAAILVAEAEALHRRRAHRADHRVDGGHQPEECVAPLRLLQVEDDAALVAVGHQKEMPHSGVSERRNPPRNIAFRRFDLDHLGPVIAQNLGRIRPEGNGRQVEDSNARKRSRHGLSLRGRSRTRRAARARFPAC